MLLYFTTNDSMVKLSKNSQIWRDYGKPFCFLQKDDGSGDDEEEGMKTTKSFRFNLSL